jgi:hypothetical protein
MRACARGYGALRDALQNTDVDTKVPSSWANANFQKEETLALGYYGVREKKAYSIGLIWRVRNTRITLMRSQNHRAYLAATRQDVEKNWPRIRPPNNRRGSIAAKPCDDVTSSRLTSKTTLSSLQEKKFDNDRIRTCALKEDQIIGVYSNLTY